MVMSRIFQYKVIHCSNGAFTLRVDPDADPPHSGPLVGRRFVVPIGAHLNDGPTRPSC